MSHGHIRHEHTMAGMLNQPRNEDRVEYRCVICKDVVMEGECTEQQLEMRACRDHATQRIAQLVQAEADLKALRKHMAQQFRNIEFSATVAANDLEGK